MNPEKLRVAREKLTRVFRYLEALNQHRNPAKRQIREQLWSLWLHDLPDHASIKRGASKSSAAKTKVADSQNGDASAGGFVLKVQRPELTSPPEPPYAIGWRPDGTIRQKSLPSALPGTNRIKRTERALPISRTNRQGSRHCGVGKWRAKNGPGMKSLLARR